MASVIAFIACLAWDRAVVAAPLPATGDSAYAPLWVDSATTRGTWDILQSCIVTIAICVWSAIHLNVPGPEEHPSVQFWRKIKWVFIGILAPEIVLLSAWVQFYEARSFCKKMNKLREKSEQSQAQKQSKKEKYLGALSHFWTETKYWMLPWLITEPYFSTAPESVSLRYGYLVVMGGIAADMQEIYDTVQTVTLTTDGVLALAKKSSCQDVLVSDEQIDDKSKTNNLLKIVLFFQVGWMVLQCITRAALHYPISILEIHTVVHAICALTMFGLWFRKPYDVVEPIILQNPRLQNQLALMMVRAHPMFLSPREGYWSDGTWLDNNTTLECRNWTYKGDHIRRRRLRSPFLSQVLSLIHSRGFDYSPILFDAEATFLIFDHSRSERMSLEKTMDPQAIFPTGRNTSIADPQSESDEVIAPCTSGAGGDIRRSRTLDRAQTTRSTGFGLSAADEPSFLSFLPPADVKIAATIKTGQVFANGLGPYGMSFQKLSDEDVQRYDRWKLNESLHRHFPYYNYDFKGKNRYEISISLSAKDFERWRRASEALRTEVAIQGKQDLKKVHLRSFPLVSYSSREDDISGRSTTLRAENIDKFWQRFRIERQNFSLTPTLLSFTFITAAYSGLHLALWTFPFPSLAESIMWKVAACVMAAPCPFVTVYIVIQSSYRWRKRALVKKKWEQVTARRNMCAADASELQMEEWSEVARAVKKDFEKRFRLWKTFIDLVWNFCLPPPLLVFLIVYSVSRLYIVVESFISLRHVPVGVYNKVTGANSIPHL